MSGQQESNSQCAPGWTTETELIREFDRPVNVADAVVLAVAEAIEEWPELSDTPTIARFVHVENLDGLFKTGATDDGGRHPSAAFQFQGCRVTVLYGSTIRVIVKRDP